MANDTKESRVPSTIPMTIQVNINVDQSFVGMLLDYADIFGPDYIGYWARGLRLRNRRGWLVVEAESLYDEVGLVDDDEIVRGFENGDKDFTDLCHFLGEEQAIEVIKKGVEEIGADFQDNYDGDSLDNALQRALLGDIVYG